MNSFPVPYMLVTGIFLLCLVTMGVGALIAVLSTRLIRSVAGLAVCCIGLAGLYSFLHSPFLALMEILIYVGAVCVTIVFAVMLAEQDEPPESPAERKAGALLRRHAALFGIPNDEIVVRDDGFSLSEDGTLASLVFRQEKNGVPVEGASVSFFFNRGSLLDVTVTRLLPVEAGTAPALSAGEARARALGHAGTAAAGARVVEGPALRLLPAAGEGAAAHRLAWVVAFRVAGSRGTWEAAVDAR